jgi:hypothetical protein
MEFSCNQKKCQRKLTIFIKLFKKLSCTAYMLSHQRVVPPTTTSITAHCPPSHIITVKASLICSCYSIQWNLYLSFPDNSFSRIRHSISVVPEQILFKLWLPHLLFSQIIVPFLDPRRKRWIEVSLYSKSLTRQSTMSPRKTLAQELK